MRNLFALTLCACGASTAPPTNVTAPSASASSSHVDTPPDALQTIALPGATGSVTVDFIASDRVHGRVWIPVGETGSVDVLDVSTRTFTRVDGFKTEEREMRGKKRTMGPSSVTLGDGVAYVGNRASNELCVVDARTLKRGTCVKIPSTPDVVAYVAPLKEVWVTTPKDHSIVRFDASTPSAPKVKANVVLAGEVEAFAVDEANKIFYTNLEDKNRTLAIDLATAAVTATWESGCGEEGPRGVAVDSSRHLVVVACTDGVRTLDAHGKVIGKLDTGLGVDDIEYVPETKLVYVAAGKVAMLTVARLNDDGSLGVVQTTPTSEGARNAAVDAHGNAYMVDPRNGRVLVVPPTKSP